MRTRDYKVCNYETDDEAELVEENFGDEGEDDNTFSGWLAYGDLFCLIKFSLHNYLSSFELSLSSSSIPFLLRLLL
jgi:hypothetical protein